MVVTARAAPASVRALFFYTFAFFFRLLVRPSILLSLGGDNPFGALQHFAIRSFALLDVLSFNVRGSPLHEGPTVRSKSPG